MGEGGKGGGAGVVGGAGFSGGLGMADCWGGAEGVGVTGLGLIGTVGVSCWKDWG